jgi:NADH:ubiquinone oxidoreductase subunit 5 (subunit L)/multisubunit Na+/H+ antiporter MnhA subunit
MDPLLPYASLVTLSPIIAFAVISLVPSSRPRLAEWIAVLGVGISAAVSLLIFVIEFTGNGAGIYPAAFQQQFEYITFSKTSGVYLGIYVDWLTVVMMAVVSSVSFLIVLYSVGYMHEEGRRRKRFFGIISMFVGVMLGLVMANNLLEMYIFWELVGLGSYLLIGFWYERPSAAKAAKKAFIVTRFGDMFLLFGIVLLLSSGNHTVMFDTLFQPGSITALKKQGLLTIATLALFGGAMGKSAQFPLQDWLVDAMEGPTPVSAMIHGATMVNAGVYLVARMYPLFSQSPVSSLFVAFTGAFTALFAATMAIATFDIKRVLAFSTISQLGYMFMALGAGAYVLSVSPSPGASAFYSLGYSAGVFHLMNQAIFKALLFLCAGSVMHALGGIQDMRRMGALSGKLRITSLTMLFGSLSLAGIVPFSGFFSKDAVLSSALGASSYNHIFLLIWLLGLIAALFTGLYIFRLWFYTFRGSARYPEEIHVHESPPVMTVPLIILAALTLVMGVAVFGVAGFAQAVHYPLAPSSVSPYEQLHGIFGIFDEPATYLSLLMAFIGLGIAYYYWGRGRTADVFVSRPAGRRIFTLLSERYYFPQLYDGLGEWIGYQISRGLDFFDRKGIDGLVNGIGRFFVWSSEKVRKSENGFVQSYADVIILGVVLLAVMLILFPILGV